MAKKIIVEEIFKTSDKTTKNQIIRQNLIQRILSIQEREWDTVLEIDFNEEATL